MMGATAVSICSATPLPEAGSACGGAWRPALHDRLRESPYPLFVFSEGAIPAASVWTGARLWTQAFRAAGLGAGDRVVLALPPSAAFLQALVGALWDGLTVALAPPPADTDRAESLRADLDARVIVTPAWDVADAPVEAGHWLAHWCEGPVAAGLADAVSPPTPDVRFLLRTSGTTGAGSCVALTDAGVWSCLRSHLPLLGLHEAESRVLSVLPWHHVFGLIFDLMPALLSGAEVVRDPLGGRDAAALIALAEATRPTHLNAVPLVLKRLLAAGEPGRALLRSLDGGIVGGAPVDAALADALSHTHLRVGYGQTEASPGIALGGPGEFPGAGYLGRPLGCETHIETERGELLFRGENACAGYWRPGVGLERHAADRWVATGDLVRADADGGLFLLGRADDAFKLANGRRVEAGVLETAIKTTFPQVAEAFLLTPDGESLTLFVALHGAETAAPTPAEAAAALGPAGRLLARVEAADHSGWACTPKGALDRAATQARLTAASRRAAKG
jgi:acyl-CoA synthetase (AMP-forming)/AMP-acid ligase II